MVSNETETLSNGEKIKTKTDENKKRVGLIELN